MDDIRTATLSREPARGAVIGADRVELARRLRLPIRDLTPTGFTVEAEAVPHAGGFVTLMRGEEPVDRRLVVCSGAGRGLVSYEFKQGRGEPSEGPDRTLL